MRLQIIVSNSQPDELRISYDEVVLIISNTGNFYVTRSWYTDDHRYPTNTA